jgi:hypothetical protein
VSPASMRGVRSIFEERECRLVGFRNSERPRGLPIGVAPGDFGSSPDWTLDTVLRSAVSAGDGDAFRRLFVVTLIRFFPTCGARR